MDSAEYENFSINDQNKNIQTPIKTKKSLFIYILIFFIILIFIILIITLTLKKKNKNNENNPSIYIENIQNKTFCTFSILTLRCINLNNYKDIKNKDITFEFTTNNNSSNIYQSDEIIGNDIKIKIPIKAISGNVLINIKKLNFKYEFLIDIITEIQIKIDENIIKSEGTDIIIDDKGISYTKNNNNVIFSFISPCTGIFDIELFASTNNDKSYINVDIDSNITLLEKRGRNNQNLTKQIISTGWNDYQRSIYGSFYLEENIEYYLKITFLKTEGMYACNLNLINLLPSENQNKKTFDMGYVIYEFDFISKSYFPFYPYWAYSPNYIKIENEYAEFYYNQKTYDNNTGVRQYKGAELTGNFSTNKDGWYGYKFYLNDTFPKNVETTIITQIFNQGKANTWAGHLHMNNKNLVLGYRGSAAANDEKDVIIGEINWNQWYNVIIYFKVGRNKKGRIKVWLSQDKLEEKNPTFDTGDINFGFGSWIDDETLDNTKIEENGKTNKIGCKFGLYTWDGGDKIIRFKKFKALEYNPDGAFNIVNPN